MRAAAVASLAAMLALASCSQGDSNDEPSETSAAADASQSSSPTPEPLPGLTPDMVLNAKIPSMCGFPAGQLKDGVLPADHPEYPNASHPTVYQEQVATGDMDGDGIDDLAAVFTCNMGGVSWPAFIQLFHNTDEGIAPMGEPYSTGDITNGARGVPEKFKISQGEISFAGRAMQRDDAAAAPSGKIAAALAWDGQKLEAVKLEDLLNGHGEVIDLTAVNGTWCLAEGSQLTGQCLDISYPKVDRGSGEPDYLQSIGTFEGRLGMAFYGAPLGELYPAGTKLEDEFNPKLPTGFTGKDRIYSHQSGELYVRSDD